MWKEFDEIKQFAVKQTGIGIDDYIDEWHQYKDLADIHIKTADDADIYGIYGIEICVYPLTKDDSGNFTTDCSKGFRII